MNKKGIAGILTALMLMLLSTTALAKEPLAVVKAPIDIVITILNDPQYQAPGAKLAQRDEIWKTLKPMFDFNEISKRAAARHWRDFSDGEKKAFADVFAEFLGNTYIDKIQGEYHNERIAYLGQDLYSDSYAEVKTHIIRETLETPVNYRLIKTAENQWKVYDILVEGVSLVKNYRSQFASILRKEKPAQLIKLLSNKLVEQENRMNNNG
jgi:phospholipid transport system substrate-binding protein